jgi:hypothetical protein
MKTQITAGIDGRVGTCFWQVDGKVEPDPKTVTFQIREESPNCFIPLVPSDRANVMIRLGGVHNDMKSARVAIDTWVALQHMKARQANECPKIHDYKITP